MPTAREQGAGAAAAAAALRVSGEPWGRLLGILSLDFLTVHAHERADARDFRAIHSPESASA